MSTETETRGTIGRALMIIAVLVVFASNRRFTMINTPAALGRPFVPDR